MEEKTTDIPASRYASILFLAERFFISFSFAPTLTCKLFRGAGEGLALDHTPSTKWSLKLSTAHQLFHSRTRMEGRGS